MSTGNKIFEIKFSSLFEKLTRSLFPRLPWQHGCDGASVVLKSMVVDLCRQVLD